ncbi:MAG: hypothetical protein RSC92_04560 [Clostridia bacterium]
MKKYLVVIISVVLCIFVNICYCVEPIYSVNSESVSTKPVMPGTNNIDPDIKSLGEDIWGNAVIILRTLAILAVVVSGLSYMFSAGDRRADIKTKLVILLIGAIIVFASTFIIEYIRQIVNEIMPVI